MTGAAPPFDAHDKAILAALQRDARISNKDLARQIGLSQSACLARVKRLEQTSVVRSYRALLSFGAVGATYEAWVFIELSNNNTHAMGLLRDALARSPIVLEAYEMAGPFDVLAHVVAHDAGAWKALTGELEAQGLLASSRVGLVQSEMKPLSPVEVE